MLTDGRTDDGRKVITIAHPEQSSGELKKKGGGGGGGRGSKTAKVVILVHDTSSGPVLHFYEVSSKYSQGY